MPCREHLIPSPIHTGKKFRTRKHRVMPIFFVNRSGMRRLPDDFHLLMTQIAADPGDHPRTDGLRTRQRRPLFDVKFQERCDL